MARKARESTPLPPASPWDRLLAFLARRDLSVREAAARLCKFDRAAVEETLARARTDRLLDDARMALRLARKQFERVAGPAMAMRAIQARGIDQDTARAAVEEALEGRTEDQLLERALLRLGALPIRRLYRRLIARGFDPERVRAAVMRRGTDPEEIDRTPIHDA